jgi:flagellar hook assembly protein FlgD
MHVSLNIFNVRGQHVRTLIDGDVHAGPHNVTWNGRDAAGVRVPSGVYIYRLEGEGVRANRRMIVLQ